MVRVKNARPGMTITLDGEKVEGPIKIPNDGKTHLLRFETPNFHPEEHRVKGTRNRTITLANRPFLFIVE
jgi:hypothetical protein